MPHIPIEPPSSYDPSGQDDRDDGAAELVPAVQSTLSRLRLESERRARSGHAGGGGVSELLAGAARSVVDDRSMAGMIAGLDGSDPLAGLLAQLRALVTRYVYGQRDRGMPPERVLAKLKALAREAMGADEWHDPSAARVLTALLVRWSITAYYDQ